MGYLKKLVLMGGVGAQLASTALKTFPSKWRVKHRLSSAEYPQFNGRAELALKTAKCIIMDNII